MAKELRSISIKGFKSLRDVTVPIGPLNVLIGQNGAGKSNFVQVFTLLRHVIQQSLQEYVMTVSGANTLLYKGAKVTQKIEIKIDAHPDYYQVSLVLNEHDKLYIQSDTSGHKDSNLITEPLWEKVSKSSWESMMVDNDHLYAKNVTQTLRNWYVYHFHDTSATAKVKLTGNVNNNDQLEVDAGNLAAFLLMLKSDYEDFYDRITKNVRLAIPFFEDFHLVPEGPTKESIRLRWKEKKNAEVMSASALSDGSLRFICLTTLLMQPNLPGLILIDEPELGLHPAAIGILGAMLRKASKRSRVIVSTQSPGLVSEFDPEDIIVANRTEEGTELKRLEPEELAVWLEDYSLGQIWDKNIIGGRP